jgi:hypothetical protein
MAAYTEPLDLRPLSLAVDPTNPFALPDLDDDGWHPQSGSTEERVGALRHYGLEALTGPTSGAEQRKRWYRGESPWDACLSPHKWVIEDASALDVAPQGETASASTHGLSARKTKSTGGSLTRGILSVVKSNMTFYKGHYEETVKLPVVGHRTTRWLVCCYISPTTRLVRCLSGFVSKEEEKFPFALATLVGCTVLPSDPPSNGLGLSYLSALGLGPAPGTAGGAGAAAATRVGGGAMGANGQVCRVARSGPRAAAFELASGARGAARIDLGYKPFKYLNEVSAMHDPAAPRANGFTCHLSLGTCGL